MQETENHANPLENTLNELTKAIKNMPDAPKYDLRGAKIDKLIDTIGVYNENNFAPEQKQNLAEAAKEIQDLLNQLAKTNPSEATIADTIQQEIKRNPTLKARLVNALKTGGIEALKAIFNNPLVSIPVETVKGFLEAES